MSAYDIYMGISNSNNLENKILIGLESNETKDAAQFVENSLGEFARLANKYNFTATLAVIPVAAQLVNDYPNQKYQAFLKRYAIQYSLDFVDLLPMLRKYYEQSGKIPVIPYDGHYDSEGHEVMGEGMVEYFREIGINCGSKN